MDRTVTLRPAQGSAPRVQQQLRLLYSPATGTAESGAVYMLPCGVTHIRRDAAQSQPHDIVLSSDCGISRLHTRIEVSAIDASVRIDDCGSRNGTFVNRCQIAVGAGQLLRDGDIVRIGSTFLMLRSTSGLDVDADVPELVGVSSSVAALRHRLSRIARESATVLILGETGTGKEAVSRALHRLSARPGTRVAVNCGAVPEGLAESQFFGHVSGAFTGAKGHDGFFRAAHRGTLLLDEVGDLPGILQPKLLRALEERSITPVGATTPVPCDVRLLAATNRDLSQGIRQGTFREDLYARLSDVVLELPPLRDRREDIVPLLVKFSDGNLAELQADVIELLLHYGWPRNVREVQKIATHLRLFGADDNLRQRLGAPGGSPVGSPQRLPDTSLASSQLMARAEGPVPGRQQLEALMQKHDGVIQRVADELGCSRRQVGRMLEQQRVDRLRFRSQHGLGKRS